MKKRIRGCVLFLFFTNTEDETKVVNQGNKMLTLDTPQLWGRIHRNQTI